MDAVRALPDVESVSFDIPTETFTVDLADGGKADAVTAAIEALGYTPRVVDGAPVAAATPDGIGAPTAASLKAALARARQREVPLVLYFGGAFCPACEAFRRDVLEDERVRAALDAFEFVAVDITEDEAAAADLGVKAVPDVWILSADRNVLARENRTMTLGEFRALLEKLSTR